MPIWHQNLEILNNPAIKKNTPKIVVGGPGAWQLEDHLVRHRLGIDCVVIGEGEKVVHSIFDGLAKGAQVPEVVYGSVAEENDIPCIQGGTIEGIIEIARGCGRGCAFCVPTLQRYRCFSIEHILKEVEVNLQAGRRPLLHAEDVLRYKARGFDINEEAVKELFSAVYNYPNAQSVGISHFALSSVASAPDLIKDLSDIIGVKKNGDWIGGQCGIETGSPRLIGELMAGKAKPFEPEQWPQVVNDAFKILSDNNWVPCGTLIIGLPGENEEDVEQTIALVRRLHEYKSLLVPLFMVSEGGLKNKSKSFKVEDITHKQSELFVACWQHNLDWAETFLNEWFLTRANYGKGFVMRRVFSYAVKQGKNLINTCQEKYDYDIPAMISDARQGKIPISRPIQIITKLASVPSKIKKK